MNSARLWICAVLAGCAIGGSSADFFSNGHEPRPVDAGEYKMLKADFHVHMFPGDATLLAPWSLVLEANRRNLDVIALTPHNHVWTAKFGEWVARQNGGPLVIVGEEVVTPTFHMLAIGINDPIDWRLSASQTIAAIHAQGGIAIAAHPTKEVWSSYDEQALTQLDGAEVWRPDCLNEKKYCEEFRAFANLGRFAAVGDSDLHDTAPLGNFYTYVFVKEITVKGVLDAVRERRTVVYDGEHYFGNSEFTSFVEASLSLPLMEPSLLNRITGYIGSVALLLILVLGPRSRKRVV